MRNHLQSSSTHPQAEELHSQRVDHRNNKSPEAVPDHAHEHTLEAACLQVSAVHRLHRSGGRNLRGRVVCADPKEPNRLCPVSNFVQREHIGTNPSWYRRCRRISAMPGDLPSLTTAGVLDQKHLFRSPATVILMSPL
jgi:hypothetical protein